VASYVRGRYEFACDKMAAFLAVFTAAIGGFARCVTFIGTWQGLVSTGMWGSPVKLRKTRFRVPIAKM